MIRVCILTWATAVGDYLGQIALRRADGEPIIADARYRAPTHADLLA